MADKKTYTGLSKNYATVPAFSITTIDYLDTKPNYFRVQNRGTTELYCSTNNMPTTKHYDFAVPGKKMKMFAEPYNRTRLYIFNPSGTDVEVAVLSFQAEFDPLTLALSEIEVEVPSNFETSTAITSFNASLPTGNNKIGKVEVTNGPSNVDVNLIKQTTDVIATQFDKLLSKTPGADAINLATIAAGFDLLLTNTSQDNMTNLHSFMPLLELITLANTFNNGARAIEKTNQNAEFVLYDDTAHPTLFTIHMLTNDGAGNLALQFLNTDSSSSADMQTLTLKPGESITDLKIMVKAVQITGTNYSFRGLFSRAAIPSSGGV